MSFRLPLTVPARIVVVGDFIVDRYWFGDAARVSQEAPVPVVDVCDVEDRPGGAANVALNVVAMGARCTFVAAVGEDAAAHSVRQTLQAAGVECDFVTVPGWETNLKVRAVSQRQQLMRADFERKLPAAAGEAVRRRAAARLAEADAVILEDYDKGAIAGPQLLTREARDAGVKIVVDPKHKDFAHYAGADVIKPNLREFERVAGAWRNEADLAAKGEAILERAGAGALVVTRGGEGLTVITCGSANHIPGSNVHVADRTGAGDTVAAALGVGLGLGWGVVDAARMANAAAGLACARSGTVAVSGAEINRALAASGSMDGGVLTQEQLIAAVGEARERGERIVFTNGCFDILHPGHVGYLAEARELGDRLVVAVNDDASAAALKGPGRPANPLRDRMRVLAALSSVDWVVPFSEDTPEALLHAVRPDVLVKGGDYAEREIVGARLVREYGGQVRALRLVEDCSTTSIISRVEAFSKDERGG